MLFGLTKKELSKLISLNIFLVVTFGVYLSKPTEADNPLPPSTPFSSLHLTTPDVLGDTTATVSGEFYTVAKVVDGDTIKVDMHGVVETVRLVGINTPESVDPRRPVECLALAASAFAKSLLANKQVALKPDPTQSNRDRYGRLLRFVFLPDGTDVGLQQILEGYAQESLYSSKPHQYYQVYVEAQAQAQKLQKGLWNPSACPIDVQE